MKHINTDPIDRNIFFQLLSQPEVIIVKFSADWCGPCQRCNDQVVNRMQSTPPGINCYIFDVDESIDLYAYLKGKKVVSGIPTILVYYPGTSALAPTFTLAGADPAQIDVLFDRVARDFTPK